MSPFRRGIPGCVSATWNSRIIPSLRPNKPAFLRVWHDWHAMPIASLPDTQRFSYQSIQFSNRSAVKTVALTNWQDAALLSERPFQLSPLFFLVAHLSLDAGMGPTGP